MAYESEILAAIPSEANVISGVVSAFPIRLNVGVLPILAASPMMHRPLEFLCAVLHSSACR